MAFKVKTKADAIDLSLEPAWVSGNFSVPEPVVIANRVVFALSNGEVTQQSKEGGIIFEHKLTLLSDQQRTDNPNRAILYALDARTGKMLYQSGEAFDTWVHFSGLAVADGSIYAVDHRSQVYCFALKED
jgi:outer membrane protein assembly factor BamB